MRIHPDALRRAPDWSLAAGAVEGYNPFGLIELRNEKTRYVIGEQNNVWVCLEPSRLERIAQRGQPPEINFACWLIYETRCQIYGGPVRQGRSALSEPALAWRALRLHPSTRIMNGGSPKLTWAPLIERFPSRLWLDDPDPFLIPLGYDVENLMTNAVVTTLLDNGWAWFVLVPDQSGHALANSPAALLALRKIDGISIVRDALGRYLWRGPGELYVMFAPNRAENGAYELKAIGPTEFEPLQPPTEPIFGGTP